MMNFRDTKGCTKEQKINSYLFELSLWKNVRISDPESGKFEFDNAEYEDSIYYPMVKVGGYNELNGIDEEFQIPCYMIISDWTISDWEEEYEKTGYGPGAKTPFEVMSYIRAYIINLCTELYSLGYIEE